MVGSIVSKVMWVGRATVFLVGLTVIFAVVLGVATTAAAHGGSKGLFHLDHNNPVTALSTLTGSVANGVLQVTNQGNAGNTTQDATAISATNNSNGSPTIRATNANGGPALDLNVGLGCTTHCARGAPMTVNSSARVDGLNSDLLDGKDSTEFISGHQVVVGSPSAFNSEDHKRTDVECPPGKVVLGGGHDISGAEAGKVVVTVSVPGTGNSAPDTGAWVVQASEIGSGTTGNWSIAAFAVCADAQ